ncbi:MAG: AAA family ATPase, partial [Candidatus Promineifilaceae bacterium]
NVETRELTQFVDSNHDQNNELLVPRFASLELLGMGVGNTGNVQEWEYTLNAAPAAALVTDLNHDGYDELIIGTQDGRLHSLSSSRSINWLFDAGDSLQALAILDHAGGDDSNLVVAGSSESEIGEAINWIQLREAQGERIWEYETGSPISSLVVADIIQSGDPEIIAGSESGEVIILSSQGGLIWRALAFFDGQPVNHLSSLYSTMVPSGEIIASGGDKIVGIDITEEDLLQRSIAKLPTVITSLLTVDELENQAQDVRIIAILEDGQVHGLNVDGDELSEWGWPVIIGSEITAVSSSQVIADPQIPGTQIPLLLGSITGEIFRFDIVNDRPLEYWRVQGQRNITDVHWYDSNSDGNPDVVLAGSRQGNVYLYNAADTSSPEPATSPLQFTSAIFKVDSLKRDVSPIPDLLVIGENGLVQLFRNQENRPPLLTNPEVRAELGQYSISIDVNDVEGDEVEVGLELQDPETGDWLAEETQTLGDGVGTVFWAFPSPQAGPEGLVYRIVFNDGFYTGTIIPPPGPVPLLVAPLVNIAPFVLMAIVATGLLLAIVYARQAQTPTARASRIYNQMRGDPSRTLILMEKHVASEKQPSLIPFIASHAREADDKIVTNLADGLYIFPEQPLSGVAIVNQALKDIAELNTTPMTGYVRWSLMGQISVPLLDAPSITELNLLAPLLEQLASELQSDGKLFQMLDPILTNLHDSERVDLAEDRLVYLNEAGVSLDELKKRLLDYAPTVEHMMVSSIVRRWSGLVGAEIEDLQGRAELAISLKTRRLVPGENTTIAVEIQNKGRAAAENLIAVLDKNPAFTALIDRQQIVYLPPGRARELNFAVTPNVGDRFRIAMTINYSDRSNQNKTAAFGDMVHLLPPVRDFSTITNPYTPGTPLRQNSLLFFGREDLFEFIAENAGHRSYRNVIILVGQRRTGKTSALLRLEDHLPDNLFPVYIDCQSLGVVPGMPALLEEMAWAISDTLGGRGIEVKVPELSAWQQDPTRLFQRQFLPYVNSLLPSGATLMLVFDEFEAFETLVAEGILPSTFFTYLRHLMQHSEQLDFIFVGTRRLEEMTSDYWSVLFNIALYRKIGFLNESAAMRLIAEPVAPKLIYDDLALDKIMRVTAGHPYFLQLVCYTMVKQANLERSGYVTISNVNAAVDEMLSLGEVHFAYLWQRSTVAERTVLATVAHLMDQTIPFHPEEIVRRLQPYDIYLDPAELTGALNSLVERDIMREVTEEAKSLFEMKLGLVSLWVAKNKSLSQLYAVDNNKTNSRKRSEPLQLS